MARQHVLDRNCFRRFATGAVACLATWAVGITAGGLEIDGFTEPYRSVDVAASEVGIIAELKVREGDVVRKGQALATLDSDLQRALLSIAEKNVESQGRLQSARAELGLRKHRLEKLETLLTKGHARQDEVERARADLAIAEAQVLAAEEDLVIRELEYQKIAVQLDRRSVYAPLDGVVVQLLKDEGEFVAPTDPYVMNLVQLDRLLATFSVPNGGAATLQLGDHVPVLLASGETVQGVVEFVAPVTDAESGTVRVKVRIENPDGMHRSGQRCSLRLPGNVADGRPSDAATTPSPGRRPRASAGGPVGLTSPGVNKSLRYAPWK
jgi:RND family efflux transporter MFP subunit